MDVTFNEARHYLEDKLPQKAEHCIKMLFNMLVPIEGMRTVKTYFREDYNRELAKVPHSIHVIWGESEVEEQVYNILRRHFSISEMPVERTEDQQQFVIPIEPIGPQYDWDSFAEDVDDPSNLSEWAGPGMLIQLLDHGWEGWENMINHFDWPLDGEPKFPHQGWWIPLDELYEKFKANGLKRLIWLWRVNTWTTGNVFWDLNLFDETTFGEDVYLPKAIPALLSAWRRAMRIQKLYEAGNQMVVDDPSLIPLQIKLYRETIQLREKDKSNDAEGA